jgi:PAS domain S-box-containing protein
VETSKPLGNHPSSAHRPKANILIVDDNRANLLVLRAILEDLGQNLLEAHSGKEALRLLENNEFAVVLLGVQMPGTNGFETAKLIRAQRRSSQTPIIFLTAYESDQFPVEQAYLLGAVDYLVKPLLPVILRAKVAGFVELYQKKERANREADQLQLLIHGTTEFAIFLLDPQGNVASWNPGAERIKQYQAEEIIGQHFSRFYPQDAIERGWPAHELKIAQSEGRFENDGWRVRKDGTQFWANVVITALQDEAGNLRGFSKITRDMTEKKRAEENAQRLLQEEAARRAAEVNAQVIDEQRERLRLALEAGRMGVWDWNIRTNEIKWSESLKPIHGLAPDTFGGTFDDFQKLIHPEDREMVNNAIRRAVETGSGYDIEFRSVWPNGSIHWTAGKGNVFADNEGQPGRMIGICMDVTKRKRSEQTARFLADASATLAALMDFDSTLQKVASLAVPYFADWASVDLAESDGSLRRVAVAHVDPTKIELAQDVHRRFRSDPTAPQGVWNIVRTGQSEFVPEINDELLVRSVKDEELLGLMRELGLKSYIGVPLNVRGKTLGVITFITAESGYLYDETDLTVAQDLADRAAIAIENAQLYRELREADRRKDEFLAMLAHELRNPLAPIRNSLQILKMPRVDAATAQQTREMMERQVHHLVRLVDDLLDVSRVMRGKIELRTETVELATVVARAVETAQPLIEAQGHELSVNLPDESLLMNADPVRLAQVIGNLLTNAAKYTEANGRIRLTANREGTDVRLRIRDNGIGIAPDMLPHIFELFIQADHAATRSQGGLGIGLTLVKNLVEMHKGTVEARSDGLGKGCEFVIRLPLMAQEDREPIEKESGKQQQEPARSSGHRLLVVDDNNDAAVSLAMLLRLQGHEVRVANDGPSALELATSYRPGLVFLDIGMPGMDGYEVARRMRRTPGLENIVLAALTGWGQQEDRRRTAEAGFDHHLVKPTEPKALESLLAELKRAEA